MGFNVANAQMASADGVMHLTKMCSYIKQIDLNRFYFFVLLYCHRRDHGVKNKKSRHSTFLLFSTAARKNEIYFVTVMIECPKLLLTW